MKKNDTDYRIKQFPTADEELGAAAMITAFTVALFGILVIEISRGAIQTASIMIVLVGGLLPLLSISQKLSIALHERQKRRRFMREGRKSRGEIVSVRELRRAVQSTHGERTDYKYVYTVHFIDGEGFDFETQEYSRPLHTMLATPYVTIYSDSMNRQHFLADFEVKKNIDDPGPFSYEDEGVNTFWRIHSQDLYALIFIIFCAVILLSNLH